jgi:nucleotide-binding universal stress UspA family protein
LGKQTYFHFGTDEHPGNSFSKILDHSIIPVMAVPKEFSIDHLDHRPLRVVIAIDGSLPSCKSMQMFAHLGIDEYCDIHLVMASKDKEYADFTLSEAEHFLMAHELTNVTKYHTTGNIIDVVDEKYLEWADMFVIGLHSKPAIMDFFTGNVTNYIIDKSKKAIFIGL